MNFSFFNKIKKYLNLSFSSSIKLSFIVSFFVVFTAAIAGYIVTKQQMGSFSVQKKAQTAVCNFCNEIGKPCGDCCCSDNLGLGCKGDGCYIGQRRPCPEMGPNALCCEGRTAYGGSCNCACGSAPAPTNTPTPISTSTQIPTSTPTRTPTPTSTPIPTSTPTKIPCNGYCGIVGSDNCGDPTGSRYHTECSLNSPKCVSGTKCMSGFDGATTADWFCRLQLCPDSFSCTACPVATNTPTRTPTPTATNTQTPIPTIVPHCDSSCGACGWWENGQCTVNWSKAGTCCHQACVPNTSSGTCQYIVGAGIDNCNLCLPINTPTATKTPTPTQTPTPTATKTPTPTLTPALTCPIRKEEWCANPLAIHFEWNPVIGATKYNVYKNGIFYLDRTESTGLVINDTAIVCGQSYSYDIRPVRGTETKSCPFIKTCSCVPTPTPSAICTGLVADKPLNNLKAGDQITFTVSFTGTPQDVGIIIKNNGSIVLAKTASGIFSTLTTWNFTYVIPGDGNYEVSSYVKSGGIWK